MMHCLFTSKLNWMRPMCIGNTACSTPKEPTMAKPSTARTPKPAAAPAAIPSEVDAILATIAKTHLDLDTLETRHSDRLDFQEQACWAIRDALRAAFEAGKKAAHRRAGSPPVVPPTVIRGDIILTSPTPKPGSGDWVQGRIGAFRFTAKVYPEHAVQANFEIGQSRISKLELRRLDTNAIAYAWDRGLDRAAVDAAAQQAVDRLAAHLANHCFGPCA
jgi:hypothetical protein